MFSNQSASEYSTGGDYDIYYTYDKNDNIKTGKTRAGVTTEYNYNDANMLTSLVNKKDSTTYSTYSYNYNLDGNINRKVESGKATDYVYDGTGRLSNEKITNGSAVTNMAYAYDNAGNRSSLTVTGTENYVTTYSYDKNNRLLKDSKKNNGASYADVTLYSYDNNGNQIRKDQSRDDLTGKPKMGLYLATANSGYGYEKFTYNGFNQLTAFEDEAGNKATYEYYSDGLRLSKTVNGAKSSYIWADNDLAMEIKSDEVISYAKAPGYMRTGSSNDRTYRNDKLYLFNGHGDVTSMIDKSGNVTKTYSYDAFGNELNRDKNDTNPFRYCGEYWDNETESIYLRARYYNPSVGRFTTEDPIKDGSNWYAYCGGNPVVFCDPSGETRIDKNGKDLDKEEFGENSLVYKSLLELTKSYNLSDSDEERASIAALANECREIGRNYNVDSAILKLPNNINTNNFNSTERVLSVKYTSEVAMVAYCKKEAMDAATKQFNNGTYGGGIDNEGDAYRHMLYAALITISTNESFAKFILDAHEYGDSKNLLKKEVYLSTKMDLYNNKIGIQIGLNYKGYNSVKKAVWDKLQSGEARKIDGTYLVPTNGGLSFQKG